jgi:hypothetical protein
MIVPGNNILSWKAVKTVHDVNISPMPNVLYLDGVLVPDQKVPDAF